jgi:hypothetical protein
MQVLGPRQGATVLGTVKAKPVVAADTASLDRPCARRLQIGGRDGRMDTGMAEQKNGTRGNFRKVARFTKNCLSTSSVEWIFGR